jgi:hypothetical protein
MFRAMVGKDVVDLFFFTRGYLSVCVFDWAFAPVFAFTEAKN